MTVQKLAAGPHESGQLSTEDTATLSHVASTGANTQMLKIENSLKSGNFYRVQYVEGDAARVTDPATHYHQFAPRENCHNRLTTGSGHSANDLPGIGNRVVRMNIG